MPEMKGKIVFITGASSGIGEACAKIFAKNGARLILSARRRERLTKIAHTFRSDYNTATQVLTLDVRNREQVQKKLRTLPKDWAAVDILINNAGLARGLSNLHEGKIEDWEEMIDTNIKGLLYVSREIIPGMVERGYGDIINIGSIAGHEVYPKGNVYCATKHAVDAITRGLRMDLVGKPIRVTTVDPGLVNTEFSLVRFHGDKVRAKNVYRDMKPLVATDVADAIYYCVTRPAHIQVAELVLFPTAQRSATIVSRDDSEI